MIIVYILSSGCIAPTSIKTKNQYRKYRAHKDNYDNLKACMDTCGEVGIKDFTVFNEGFYKDEKIISCQCKDNSGWQMHE